MKKLLWKIGMFFTPYEQPIFYSPKVNRFFQVKFSQDNGLLCGGFAEYYHDAITNIQKHVLSYDAVWECKRVNAIDKFPFAKLCTLTKSYKVK